MLTLETSCGHNKRFKVYPYIFIGVALNMCIRKCTLIDLNGTNEYDLACRYAGGCNGVYSYVCLWTKMASEKEERRKKIVRHKIEVGKMLHKFCVCIFIYIFAKLITCNLIT